MKSTPTFKGGRAMSVQTGEADGPLVAPAEASAGEGNEPAISPKAGGFRRQLRPALLGVLLLTLLTGVVFPLALAAVACPLFPRQVEGGLLERDAFVVGSELVGQDFAGPGYFHPRPSAAGTGSGYDATASGGTNLGPAAPELRDAVRQRVEKYRRDNGLSPDTPVPIDAVTASGSGLDPHISPANAALQVPRVARQRNLGEETVSDLVARYTSGPQFGFLGAPRVAVLPLNLALDRVESPPLHPTAKDPASVPPDRRWLEYLVFLGLLLVLARPAGLYLARVFEGKPTFPDKVLRPVEAWLYRLLGVRPEWEVTPATYLLSFIAFSALGTLLLFGLLLAQQWLPGGPDERYLATPMNPDLAANTALSFSTTTTWQAYGGESTLRYLAQVVGLAAQNFLAGAAGLAVGIAFIRGFARRESGTLGNFWVDLVRALLWVLLPLALAGGVVLVWQGVPLNLSPYTEVRTLEGPAQTIAQGPVAALEFIKNLGTNGGGFFNANGAHPLANPTPLTNFLGMLAIAVLPAALTITFGHLAGRPRAGWVLLGVMVVLFMAGLAVCDAAEAAVPPRLADLGVIGGNLEGKEVRFGVGSSVLTAVVTSNGATGSNNSMHDSYQPAGVLVMVANMLLGEVIFGGLGTGLFSMVFVALVGVFMGGLMVGRTPEYLGKTITATEAKLVALYVLLTPLVVLALTGAAISTEAGRAGLGTNRGPHAFAEVLFTYASCMANNGQAMASLSANNPFYNLTTMAAMAAGRFGFVALALVLAGRFAAQGRKAATIGTLPCDTFTFGVLVLGSVVLIGALCFLPALALGPVAEWFQP
jgi:potassium-transporting ATPase potassium-binding subunit